MPVAFGLLALCTAVNIAGIRALLTRFEAKVYLVLALAPAAGLASHLFPGRRDAKAA